MTIIHKVTSIVKMVLWIHNKFTALGDKIKKYNVATLKFTLLKIFGCYYHFAYLIRGIIIIKIELTDMSTLKKSVKIFKT